MLLKKYNILSIGFVLIALACLCGSCSENDYHSEHLSRAGFAVKVSNVSTTVQTRTTPDQLPKPAQDKFGIKITKVGNRVPVYDGPIGDGIIPISPGHYDITASYGDAESYHLDYPCYSGTRSNIEAIDGEIVPVNIECSVANALVSVRFGATDEEVTRFKKFYSDCQLLILIGDVLSDDRILRINSSNANATAYFPAGKTIKLGFSGTLAKDGKEIYTDLPLPEGTPTTLAAADHLIVTLSLPDPGSAAGIIISKAEVTEATVEETIPLSWLPVPKAVAEHQYDAKGNLTGTNLIFSDSYPGMQWKAEVTDASNNIVRTASGTGTLKSDETDDTWPYLPAGSYKATYYIINDGKESQTGTRDFTVPAPNLSITLDGYTSYDLYLAGDIDGANECEGNKAYGLKASINISKELLSNTRYNKNMSCTFSGESIPWTEPTVEVGDNTQEPRLDAHVLNGNVTFAGTTISNSKNLYLTGLPTVYGLPTQAKGWTGHGSVTWNDSDNGTPRIRLGQNTTSQPQYIDNAHFGIPAGTWVTVDYDVIVHGATVATTFTLTVGSDQFFKFESSSGLANSKDHPFRNGTSTKQLSEAATSVRANNSYGSGQTRSWVYALGYKYGNAQ